MVVRCYKHLQSKNEYILSKQLLRSGTSIGANINEAQAAQTRKDFIAKMSVAAKETRETAYWIRLLEAEDYLVSFQEKEEMKRLIDGIGKMLTTIIKTAQANIKQ